MASGPHTVVHIEKGRIGFAAAHFTCLGESRERLHGHNYTVGLRVHGEVGADGTLVDFAELKALLTAECDALDHRMVLPGRSADLSVESTGDGHLAVRHRDGSRFLFPAADCALLPLANSTCECLAALLLERLRARLGDRDLVLEVSVDESPGQGARVVEGR